MTFIDKSLCTLLVLMISSSCTLSFSKQQINNSGFEDQEEIRSEVGEPVYWNSIKNTDGTGTLTADFSSLFMNIF